MSRDTYKHVVRVGGLGYLGCYGSLLVAAGGSSDACARGYGINPARLLIRQRDPDIFWSGLPEHMGWEYNIWHWNAMYDR